ncbi:MAG: phosphoribosylanthranilate isomerase [Ardenticatenaceae bacterium]|nr:phosphoribosylanthranilate isomerase [Ardenticatenaceae bacterium]HBY94426.1 N-(5'-phosphoribosyl)anthranilate isomerase [Chloroflexota bacterium]
MSTVRVKICGITRLEDGRVAAEAGADLLGFVFYSKSPRAVTAEVAAEIVAGLRETLSEATPTLVGVFVDEPVARVQALLDRVRLDGAQLHGSEPPVELRLLGGRAYKAIRPQTRGDAEAMTATYYDVVATDPRLPQFLLDTYDPWLFGGTGTMADLAVAKLLAGRFRLMLAGGLTPASVAGVVAQVQPWGVDVASGVERAKGIKDHALVREFVRRAKSIEV